MLLETYYSWATPLFSTQLGLPNEQREALKKTILDLSKRQVDPIDSQVAIPAKHRLLESPLDFFRAHKQNPAVNACHNLLVDGLTMAIHEANAGYFDDPPAIQTLITESWYHVTSNGGYHDSHSHPNCSWCGIYCVETPEKADANNGVNRFYDPRPLADHYQDAATQYLSHEGVWDFDLPIDSAVFFPSYLKHAALPFFTQTKERIVIAFNSQTHAI
ncbi:MAG: putative 2OG-Fe(II) oxygenase [Cellvibrionales bacterium]|nr:putative 2OG-Fe(II) oxygenase [Cellvibrionales bacterium]